MPWPANATKSEEDSSSVGRNTEKGSESTGTAAGSQHEQILPTLVRSLAIHQIPDSAESSADRKIEEATKTGKPVTAGQQQEARFHSIIFNKGEENLAMRGIQKTKCAIIQTTKTLKEAAFNQQKALSPVHLFTQSIEDTNENLDFRKANYSLTSLRFWDIQVHPVKQRMVAGHLVPTAKSVMSPFMSKQRRISLEYHEPEETSIKRRGSGATKLADYREQNDQKRASLFQQASQEQNRTTNLIDKASLGDKDRFYFIILKHMDDSPQGAAGNDLSTSDGWHIRYEVPFQELELVHSWDRSIELRVGQDTDTKVRIFQFSCQEDTSAFLNLYHHVKQLYQERTKRLANAYTDKVKSHLTPTKTKPTISQRSVLESVNQYELKESDLQPKWKTNLQKIGFSPLLLLSRPKPKKETTTEDSVKLLVEIVSASLPDVLDLPNIGPFVKVTDGNNVVHTTKVIPKT